MFNLNEPLVFHKIGKGYLNTVTDKFLEITYGQKMKFDVKSTTVDVEGGDSLFPIYTFISKKEGTITIDGATFSLSQAAIANPVTNTTTNNLVQSRVLVTKSSTSLGTSLTGITDVKAVDPTGALVTVVIGTAPATPDASTLYITSVGALTFGSALVAGEYTIWFKSITSSDSTMSGFLKDSIPEVSEFQWTFEAENTDGDKFQVDIYAKRVRCDGSFTVDLARSTASVPQLTLKILDPGDGSDDFCTITATKIAA